MVSKSSLATGWGTTTMLQPLTAVFLQNSQRHHLIESQCILKIDNDAGWVGLRTARIELLCLAVHLPGAAVNVAVLVFNTQDQPESYSSEISSFKVKVCVRQLKQLEL